LIFVLGGQSARVMSKEVRRGDPQKSCESQNGDKCSKAALPGFGKSMWLLEVESGLVLIMNVVAERCSCAFHISGS
jgi:hypothetical protein